MRLFKFAGVGIVATLVHYFTALAAVYLVNIPPEIANIIGFMIAFIVSFIGHWRWTFGDHMARFRQALPSFAVVAASMFFVNALFLHLLLRYTYIRFEFLLLLVQALVFMMTFAISKYWAFAKPIVIDRAKEHEARV